jgi:hypothetical protein
MCLVELAHILAHDKIDVRTLSFDVLCTQVHAHFLDSVKGLNFSSREKAMRDVMKVTCGGQACRLMCGQGLGALYQQGLLKPHQGAHAKDVPQALFWPAEQSTTVIAERRGISENVGQPGIWRSEIHRLVTMAAAAAERTGVNPAFKAEVDECDTVGKRCTLVPRSDGRPKRIEGGVKWGVAAVDRLDPDVKRTAYHQKMYDGAVLQATQRAWRRPRRPRRPRSAQGGRRTT